ncbi:MAG: sarcosine oxidase subunit gamma family protein [Candidatus Sphingomonas phytovorans]|nr:sarcosine oxidase subunit gamma family protein [Sphingomonas sp.]WEK01212.1 MAG: sarcosine oxidase subunit gamma family protein [Sphingomonas sp.]
MADTASTLLARAAPVATGIRAHGFVLDFEPFLGVAKLHLLGDDAIRRITLVLGAPLPPACRETAIGTVSCAWLGPAEWMLTGREAHIAPLVERCREAAGDEGLIVDLTHGRASFVLYGRGARDALSTHCPLDLSDEAMPVSSTARSLLGDAPLFVVRLDDRQDHPAFRLILDQTMAPYALRLFAAIDQDPGVIS